MWPSLFPGEPQEFICQEERGTSEAGVEQVFPGVAQQSVGEDEVERTQQQMIRVHQVIADHGEVPCTRTKEKHDATRGNYYIFRLSWHRLGPYHCQIYTGRFQLDSLVVKTSETHKCGD